MRNYMTLLFFASTLIGCQTVVDIDVPLSERRLVINALNNPDSVWNVKLSLTRHVLDNETFFEIPDASSVAIIDPANNSVVEHLKFFAADQRYKGLLKPVVGKEYLLKVTAPKYGTAGATTTIPANVPIVKVEVDNVGANSQDGMVPVKIYFKDPPSQKNFYKVWAIEKRYFINFQTKDTIQYENPVYLEVSDPSLKSDYNYGNELLFDDVFFDGNNYVLAIKINSYSLRSQNNSSIKIFLSSLSEPYYRYATTMNLQQYTSGDPFAQPVLVYGNIENGLGIFGGYTQSVFVLKK